MQTLNIVIICFDHKCQLLHSIHLKLFILTAKDGILRKLDAHNASLFFILGHARYQLVRASPMV